MSRYKQPYSLYKRGNVWYYRTYSPDGVRTGAKSTGQTSKTAAKSFCDALYLRGELWTSDKTFGVYAKHFYDDDSLYFKDRVEKLSENTVKNYQKHFKNSIMPYFDKIKLCDINYSTLKKFRISLLEEGYSALTIQSILSVLKHVIQTAYRDRLIPINPFDMLEPLKLVHQERDAFTLDEIKFIVQNLDEEFSRQIIIMALTGMRISESVGVTLDDIKCGNKFEYINLTKQMNKGKYKPLKNKNIRDIPIIPELKNFIGFDKTRVSAFYRNFVPIKNQIERADERKLSFHSLRHFFITSSKSENVNESKVEVIAGHSLKGITKVYTNFKVDDLTDILSWQEKIYGLLTAPE